MKRIIFLSIFLLIACIPTEYCHARDCKPLLSVLSTTAKATGQFFLYPAWPFIVHSVRRSEWQQNLHEQNRPSLLRTMREELFGKIGLAMGALYFSFVFFGQTVTISQDDIVSATPDFDEIREEDVVVVINAHSDHHRAPAKARGEELTKKYRNVFYIESTDQFEIQRRVGEIARNNLITRLEFHSHGGPGFVLLGSLREGKSVWVDELFDSGNRRALFGAQAKVRFHGCRIAQGPEGRRSMSLFAEKHLQQKGEVIASELSTTEVPSTVLRTVPFFHITVGALSGRLLSSPPWYTDPANYIVRTKRE